MKISKIVKGNDLGNIEEIHKELSKVDSLFLDASNKLNKISNDFINDRDRKLIDKLIKLSEYAANRTLLLEGRITHYELGTKIFIEHGNYRQFMVADFRKGDYYNKRYIPLTETNYSGKKFSNFMKKELGAKAEMMISKETKKEVILSILIPEEHRKLILY